MPNFSQTLNLEVLSKYFHLPINEVARELGICATVLKKICRRNSVPRWPHRKIKSIDKRLSMLQLSLTKNPDDETRIRHEMQSLQDKKDLIYRQPNILALPKNRRNTKKRTRDEDSDDEVSDFSGSDEFPSQPTKRRWSVSSPGGTPPPRSPLRAEPVVNVSAAPPSNAPEAFPSLPAVHQPCYSAPTLPSLRSVAFHAPSSFSIELPRIILPEIRDQAPAPKQATPAGFHMLALAAESLDILCAAAADGAPPKQEIQC